MSEIQTNSELMPTARLEGDNLIAAVRGEIDLHNSPDLRTALLGAISKSKFTRLILNLSQVPYMDSSAIAVLVEVLQKVKRAGGKVCLTNLQPRVTGLPESPRPGSVSV